MNRSSPKSEIFANRLKIVSFIYKVFLTAIYGESDEIKLKI